MNKALLVAKLDEMANAAFENGDEAHYRKHAGRYFELTGHSHRLWDAFEAEMQEIASLSDLCLSATLSNS